MGDDTWYFVESIQTNPTDMTDNVHLMKFQEKGDAKKKRKFFEKIRNLRKKIAEKQRKSKGVDKDWNNFSKEKGKYDTVIGNPKNLILIAGFFKVGDIVKDKDLDKFMSERPGQIGRDHRIEPSPGSVTSGSDSIIPTESRFE